MRRRLALFAAAAMLALLLSCALSGASLARTGGSDGLPRFKIHLGSVQLTVGPTRFRHCRPSMIGARCEPIGGDPSRRYYAVSIHHKTRLAGLWRETQRWIIPVP
jgi:hypothetical protein